MTIQKKATVYDTVVINLEYLAEMLKCDHSNKEYSALLSCSTVHNAAENCSNFENCGWNT